MSMISSFFHPENGYKQGQKELEKYYNQGQATQKPFVSNANNVYPALNTSMNDLLHPEQLQNQWSQNYIESPAAKQAQAIAEANGASAAGSMGMGGSNSAIQAIQSNGTNIVNQDRQKYLDDLWNKYQTGLGIGTNTYNTGANTATNMATNAMNMGQNSAQTKFGETNAPGDMFSKLLQGVITAATPVGQAYGMNKLGISQPWSTTGGQ